MVRQYTAADVCALFAAQKADLEPKMNKSSPDDPNMAPPDRRGMIPGSSKISSSMVNLPALDENLVASMLDQQLVNKAASWSEGAGVTLSIALQLPGNSAYEDAPGVHLNVAMPKPSGSYSHRYAAPPAAPLPRVKKGSKSGRAKPPIDISMYTPYPLIPDGFMGLPQSPLFPRAALLPMPQEAQIEVIERAAEEYHDEGGPPGPAMWSDAVEVTAQPRSGQRHPSALANEVDEAESRVQALLGGMAAKTEARHSRRKQASYDNERPLKDEHTRTADTGGKVVVKRQVGGQQGQRGRLMTGRMGRTRHRHQLQDVPQFRQTEELERQALEIKHRAQRQANRLGMTDTTAGHNAPSAAMPVISESSQAVVIASHLKVAAKP